MGKKNKVTPNLGRALIKDRFGAPKGRKMVENNSMLHTTEVQDGYDWGRLNLQSVTEESSFQEFLSTAELAGTEFQGEKLNVTFVNPRVNVGLLSSDEAKKVREGHEQHKELIKIPRRPKWDSQTTAEELDRMERENFLEWRRSLATLQEKEGFLLTPFEKNLEFWRQLWRVVERSDVVVQIVDARNPLLFRCEDLEEYVREISAEKINMILINKADFLTDEQRQIWADYFSQQGMKVAFFSALQTEDNIEESPEENTHVGGEKVDESDEEAEEELAVNLAEKLKESPIEVKEEEGKPLKNSEISTEDKNDSLQEEESLLKTLKESVNLLDEAVEKSAEKLSKIQQNIRESVNFILPDQTEETNTQNPANFSQDSNSPISFPVETETKKSPGNSQENSRKSDKLSENTQQKLIKKPVSFSLQAEISPENTPEKSNRSEKIPENSQQKPVENFPVLLSKHNLINLFRSIYSGPKTVTENVTTIGLVGYPNVGKSSTINSLLTAKKVSVSATPGKTKHFQTLYLDKDLLLCDCPGLVMPSFVFTKAEMVVSGILPIDQMRDHVPPVNLVASVIPRYVFEDKYGVMLPIPEEGENPNRPPTSEELLNAYGYIRGFMTANGQPDNPRSARYVLKDFVNGRLLYCHAPPGILQESYHKFPEKIRVNRPLPPREVLAVKPSRMTVADLDRAFFKTESKGVHIKGVMGKSAGIPANISEMQTDKPWKKVNKHANKNKREKLRRVYSHLDQH